MNAAVALRRHDGPVLVLGVGNLLWADEGFGVRCVEAFAAAYDAGPGVEVVEGGTQGLTLVNALAAARRVLLFDAVDVGETPGAMVVARGADVPQFVAAGKVSLHQTSMMEVLALAELLAEEPPEAITLLGCQPVDMEDYGGGLTAPVAARVPEAVALAAAELARWGAAVTPRAGADAATHGSLMPEAVARTPYETQRPSADAACRTGDARVLARAAPTER